MEIRQPMQYIILSIILLVLSGCDKISWEGIHNGEPAIFELTITPQEPSEVTITYTPTRRTIDKTSLDKVRYVHEVAGEETTYTIKGGDLPVELGEGWSYTSWTQ